MTSTKTPPTVIVLGAGASCSEGAPLQASLFRDHFKLQQAEASKWVHHEWDRELATFFEDFFGIDVDHEDLDKLPFPTFEEVRGVLEIADSQSESFRDWGTSHLVEAKSKPRVQHIRDLLILLIAQVLDQKLGNRSAKHHSRLLKKLGPTLAATTFVSFNYDILHDNALVDLHESWDLDYAIEFSNYDDGSWHRPRPDRSVKLLKLHGSLNWLYCPTCRAVTLTPKEKGVCKLKWNPESCLCGVCETLAVPIVIPPTYFKALSNLYLREIWAAAERALLDSDRIVFCGYSFPDADIHVRYLLKRVELNRRRPTQLNVFVVNEHNGKTDEARLQERNRYLRFFRDKARVHWTDLSFEDFASDPMLIEDPKRWR